MKIKNNFNINDIVIAKDKHGDMHIGKIESFNIQEAREFDGSNDKLYYYLEEIDGFRFEESELELHHNQDLELISDNMTKEER